MVFQQLTTRPSMHNDIYIFPTDTIIYTIYIISHPSSRLILMYAVSLAHLQVPECSNGSTVPTSAGPEVTLPGVLVHVLPQDHLPALLKCALHP